MNLTAVLNDPNTMWILLGSMLLGLSSGVIGTFAYLRKQALIGDALSHAALPGICIAFLITGTKSIIFFLIGAAISGLMAIFLIGLFTRKSRIKQDSAFGIVLSVFFGAGIVMLTRIQQGGAGNQSGLDKFLFGQTASMLMSDVITMVIISLFLITVTALCFKEFKLVSFDPGFASGIGYPVSWLEYWMMFLIVISVVTGIQAVGVVLMVALLITPAVSARYWTEDLRVMIVLSGFFGMMSGISGTLLSTVANNLPTGPLTVLSASFWFLISVIFAPKRGVLMKLARKKKIKREYLRSQQTIMAEGRKSV